MPSSSRYIIGIDLGTTNSVLSYIDTLAEDPRPQILPILQLSAPGAVTNSTMLPSFGYFGLPAETKQKLLNLPSDPAEIDSSFAVGQIARNKGSHTPGRVIVSAKSWLSLAQQSKMLPYGSEDVPAEQKLSPLEASSRYLEHLKKIWNSSLGSSHEDYRLEAQEIIITVPASFDESAQRLTLEAAHHAGFPESTRLLEEPQAAFYDWLAHTGTQQVPPRIEKILVIDIGGGTTDLSLFRVSRAANEKPQIERLSVSTHLLLGGDNIDIGIAELLEPRLAGANKKLSRKQWTLLTFQARELKEKVFTPGNETAEFKISLPSEGASLFAGSLSASIRAQEILDLILEKFFAPAGRGDRPDTATTPAIGLPYPADVRVSRHLAAFLANETCDAIICNGGSLKPQLLQERLCDLLQSWQPQQPITLLENADLDLAVARGAASFAWLRRTRQATIHAGYPRSLYLEVASAQGKRLCCLLPKGTPEGSSYSLQDNVFRILVGKPARFQLHSSPSRAGDTVGAILPFSQDFMPLPPLHTIIESAPGEKEINAALSVTLSDAGLLTLSIQASDQRRWELSFAVRDTTPELIEEGDAGLDVDQESFAKAAACLDAWYSAKGNNENNTPSNLWRDLEKALGQDRDAWSLQLTRALWKPLQQGLTRRSRSLAHEANWLNLAGYCLRPGFGAGLDEFRMRELWRCFELGLYHKKDARAVTQWWIMWRRVAGGLGATEQQKIFNGIQPVLQKPAGDYGEAFQLAAALERLPVERKRFIGDRILKLITAPNQSFPDSLIHSLGRLGSRVPLSPEVSEMFPAAEIEKWFHTLETLDWTKGKWQHLVAAWSSLARRVDDRQRDISEDLREKVLAKLRRSKATPAQLEVVMNFIPWQQRDTERVLGEALPIGISL